MRKAETGMHENNLKSDSPPFQSLPPPTFPNWKMRQKLELPVGQRDTCGGGLGGVNTFST